MLKKFFLTAVSSLCIVSATACTNSLSYYEKVNTALDLSDEIMELYSEDKISVGEYIYSDNVSDYCTEDKEIYKILNSDNECQHYKVCIIDDNKVLVETNVIFHSVEGYVITTDGSTLSESLDVPESLGFDGNSVSVVPLEDDYPNVYTFRAGL